MSASRVHSANSTRTTSRGSTQWTAVSRGGSAKGGSSRSSPRRRAGRAWRGRAREQVVSGPGVQAAAHLARETQLAVAIMHAEQEGAEVALRDAARLPAAPHELLLPPCLHPEPGVRAGPPRALAGEPLALLEGDVERRAAVEVVEDNARLRARPARVPPLPEAGPF